MLKKLLPEFADLPDLDLDLINVPEDTPVNLIMNVHAEGREGCSAGVCGWGFAGPTERRSSPNFGPRTTPAAHQRMMEKLLEVNMCPDFIEDRGHTYGRELSDDDKRALIEYQKSF